MITGERHRKQRRMLNPVFSPQHLQGMVPIFYSVSYKACHLILCISCLADLVIKLRDAILSRVNTGPQEIDMLHWFGRTSLEFVGQSGLGEHLVWRLLFRCI